MLQPTVKVTGGLLTITLPLKEALKERRESESGKSLLLASVAEKIDVENIGVVRIGLNVFQKNPAYMATPKA